MNEASKISVERLCAMLPTLNERQRRNLLAHEAKAFGHGGIKIVSEISGISRTTISKGIKELAKSPANDGRARKKGGGRKPLVDKYPTLLKDLLELLESSTRGDPMSTMRWTSKSTRKLAEELCKKGYKICHNSISKLLKKLEYSLQANKKTNEGGKHVDRDAQFEHINNQAKEFLKNENPVISVDTKKKNW